MPPATSSSAHLRQTYDACHPLRAHCSPHPPTAPSLRHTRQSSTPTTPLHTSSHHHIISHRTPATLLGRVCLHPYIDKQASPACTTVTTIPPDAFAGCTRALHRTQPNCSQGTGRQCEAKTMNAAYTTPTCTWVHIQILICCMAAMLNAGRATFVPAACILFYQVHAMHTDPCCNQVNNAPH